MSGLNASVSAIKFAARQITRNHIRQLGRAYSKACALSDEARQSFARLSQENQIRKKKTSLLNLQFTELRFDINPSEEDIKQLVAECIERNCIFLSYRALSNQGQLLLGARVAENSREKLAVCCDMPYDLLGMPGFENVLATFDPSEQAMQAPCDEFAERRADSWRVPGEFGIADGERKLSTIYLEFGAHICSFKLNGVRLGAVDLKFLSTGNSQGHHHCAATR